MSGLLNINSETCSHPKKLKNTYALLVLLA